MQNKPGLHVSAIVSLGPAFIAGNSMHPETILVVLLRLAGGVTVLAFGAMFLPTDWMAATHRWLGLGDFPRTPVVDYLTRSVAALYGFHGALLFLVSGNPVRYLDIVRYVGVMNLLFGVFMLIIDLHAGLPLWWTLGEGPPVSAFGVVVLYLCRSLKPAASHTSQRAPTNADANLAKPSARK